MGLMVMQLTRNKIQEVVWVLPVFGFAYLVCEGPLDSSRDVQMDTKIWGFLRTFWQAIQYREPSECY